MNPQHIQIGYYEITDMYYQKEKDEDTFKNFILTENSSPIPYLMIDMMPLVGDDDELIFGLYLRDNNLKNEDMKKFVPFPTNLVDIDIENNKFTKLPTLPNYLQGLNIRHNNFKKLPTLPNYLQRLNIENNKFTKLPPLPNNLQRLNIRHNNFKKLPELTGGSITHLYCDNNKLANLPELYKLRYLKELNCSNNSITKIPELPSNLIELHCSDNSLRTLPDFPESLRVLSCRGNNFDEETVSRIIEFYKKAIENNYKMTNPSFQEELDYFNTNRSITAHIVLSKIPVENSVRKYELPHGIRDVIIGEYADLRKSRKSRKSKVDNKTFLKKKTSKKKENYEKKTTHRKL
jgi:hypothetical protein